MGGWMDKWFVDVTTHGQVTLAFALARAWNTTVPSLVGFLNLRHVHLLPSFLTLLARWWRGFGDHRVVFELHGLRGWVGALLVDREHAVGQRG